MKGVLGFFTFFNHLTDEDFGKPGNDLRCANAWMLPKVVRMNLGRRAGYQLHGLHPAQRICIPSNRLLRLSARTVHIDR